MKRSYEHPQQFVLEIYDQALGELIPDAIQHPFLLHGRSTGNSLLHCMTQFLRVI